MKILIFNWQDIKNPLAGGAEVHMHEIFSRVVKMGHEVTLYCSSFEGAKHEETIDGIKVIREGGRYLFNFRVPYRYLTRFSREHYDVVIDDMNKIPFFTPLYVREPLYILIHHLFDKNIFRETSLPFALYVYLTEKAGVAVCRNMGIPLMVVSESTKAEMKEKGFKDNELEIVYNCVDHDRHKPDPAARSATPLAGYFGRLKKYKSVEHLLEAFATVRREQPALKLVVIGEGDYRSTLETISGQLGISDAVQFTGYVDENQKVRLLQQVWFVVNTSSKEGWGLTVIESNACGTAVLGSNVPGLRDAIRDGETGLLYEYGNVSELSAKMTLLLKDLPLRERLGKAAISWAGTFDWNTVAGYTLKLLERIIQEKNRAKS